MIKNTKIKKSIAIGTTVVMTTGGVILGTAVILPIRIGKAVAEDISETVEIIKETVPELYGELKQALNIEESEEDDEVITED